MGKRQDIKSGDLLIWKDSKKSFMSNLTLNAIRLLTRSEYAHVAVAWRNEDNQLCKFEASQPKVRMVNITNDDAFFHIPMSVAWNDDSLKYLKSKEGLKYSIFDAIRAFFGITLENDSRYQCAELANEFYALHGINLAGAFTPSALVHAILANLPTTLNFVSSE
jgi:hypothetical protein